MRYHRREEYILDDQLLKMNGLSLEILDSLSYESQLGISLKKNLHHFDKDLLIQELIAMTEWLDEQEILADIALDYRIKSIDSILNKYDRYYPDHQTRKVFNDILGFRRTHKVSGANKKLINLMK